MKWIMDVESFEKYILTSIKELKSDCSKVKNKRMMNEIYKELFICAQILEDIKLFKKKCGFDE